MLLRPCIRKSLCFAREDQQTHLGAVLFTRWVDISLIYIGKVLDIGEPIDEECMF